MKLKKLLKHLREDEKFVLSEPDTGSGGLVTNAGAVLETMPYFWKYPVLRIEHDEEYNMIRIIVGEKSDE
ncbi:MAG: hypothetical protein E7496_06660 [Ruminococcus sp.]|nr:hypothetical protein [Ruminococcus sp.]